MSARLAAALTFLLLPACGSCLASPIGVLTGPFAGQVLAQQRQEAAQTKTADRKTDQVAAVVCQPERATKRAASPAAAKSQCEMPVDDSVAARIHTDIDPLPEPDKKSTAN